MIYKIYFGSLLVTQKFWHKDLLEMPGPSEIVFSVKTPVFNYFSAGKVKYN